MPIPNGYRLLTSEDIGKVFGVDLETNAYLYFENDSVDFPSVWDTQRQLTNFITYNYDEQLGGTPYISFDSGIVSGADNLWLYTPPSFEYCTIAEGTELTTFNTDADWNTWFYVKDISNPYNIISTKPKITINCKNKIMTKDLTIIRELWDGSYEEIFNGYTLTLEGTLSQYLEEFSYSIDGGISYTKVDSLPVTIEEVTRIKFKMTTTYEMFVGIESNDSSIDMGWFPDDETIETEEIEITSNITLEIISNIV